MQVSDRPRAASELRIPELPLNSNFERNEHFAVFSFEHTELNLDRDVYVCTSRSKLSSYRLNYRSVQFLSPPLILYVGGRTESVFLTLQQAFSLYLPT